MHKFFNLLHKIAGIKIPLPPFLVKFLRIVRKVFVPVLRGMLIVIQIYVIVLVSSLIILATHDIYWDGTKGQIGAVFLSFIKIVFLLIIDIFLFLLLKKHPPLIGYLLLIKSVFFDEIKRLSLVLLEKSAEFFRMPPKTKWKILKRPLVLLAVIIIIIKIQPYFKTPNVTYFYPENNAAEMPLDTVLEVIFDRPMLRKSVEESIKITPDTPGKFEWEADMKLRFIPNTPLNRDATYTVTFVKTMLSKFLSPLNHRGSYTFSTLGNPKVVVFNPATSVTEDNVPITVIFDRPMIPLTTTETEDGFAPPISIEPEIKGQGRWLGTTAYQFRPESPFLKATKYTVTVLGGIKSVDGGFMENPFQWNFTGELPRVISTYPKPNENYANPYETIRMDFSQQVKLESLEEIFTAVRNDGSIVTGNLYCDANDKKVVFFKPDFPMERTYTYTFSVPQGLAGIEGEEKSIEPYSWSFRIADYPKVLSSSPMNGQKGVTETYQLSIVFNGPMNEESLINSLNITPQPKNKPSMYFSTYSNTFGVYFQMERSKTYNVNLANTARDIHGYYLNSDYNFSFTTAALAPAVSIQPSNRYFSVFNRQINPIIITKSTNNPAVTYDLYRLTHENFIHLYRMRYDYEYVKQLYGQNYNYSNWQSVDTSKFEKILSWSEELDNELNTSVNVISKIRDKDGNIPGSGMYFLDIKGAGSARDNIVMIITKSTLTIKVSPEQAFVWAVDQTTGKPVKDMSLTLYNKTGSALASGKTDENGVWSKDIPLYKDDYSSYNNRDFIVTGSYGDDFVVAATNWNDGIDSSDFDLGTYWSTNEDYRLFVTLDSPIYRPGETVNFKGLVRKDNDGKFESLKPGTEVAVKVTDQDGNIISQNNFKINSFGSFWGNVPLSLESKLGMYNVSAVYQNNTYSQSFQVEEYRKPEFSLKIEPMKEKIIRGDSNRAVINASYYFGAPLSGVDVNWTLKRKDYYFSWKDGQGYDFTDDEEYFWWRDYYDPYSYGEQVTQGKGVTDKYGDLIIDLPTYIPDIRLSQELVIDALVQDKSNQAIAGSGSFVLHQGDYYIGLKPSSYVNQENQDADINYVTIATDQQIKGNTEVSFELYKRVWNTVREQDPDTKEYFYATKVQDILEAEKDGKTNDRGYGKVTFRPESGGTYKIVASSKDKLGNTVRSSTFIWVSGEDYRAVRENHDRIKLISDNREYTVGETAEIFADSPYPGKTKSLFTVERGKVLSYFIGETGGESAPYKLYVNETYSPNVYVGVVIPKPGDSIKNPPEFKMGYVKLNVFDPSKKVDIDISTDKPTYQPGDKMKISINAKTQDSKKPKMEILLGVVDKAEWDLSDITMKDIYSHFYREKALKVVTSNLLTVSLDRINANVDLGAKGGSGGKGGAGDGWFDTARTEFLKTAFWKPDLQTDSNGNAYAEFELPDNLTTWKIIAIANSETAEFGSKISEAVTTKDFIIRPFLPRFISGGDSSQLGAIILNKSGSSIDALAAIDTEGVQINGEAIRKISLDNGAQQKVTWDVKAGNREKAVFRFSVKNLTGETKDSVELSVPIRNNYTMENNATSGEIRNTVEQKILLPEGTIRDIGNLTVEVFPNPGLSGLSAIDYMSKYPYGCGEQTTSKLISAVTVEEIMRLSGAEKISGTPRAVLKNLAETELQTLNKKQNLDGGWAWWIGNSDPFLTSYILHGLKLAKNSGYTVPDNLITKANTYLITVLRNSTIVNSTQPYGNSGIYTYSSRQNPLDSELAVYILYVLEDSRSTVSYAPALFQNRFRLSLTTRARLATTMLRTPGLENSGKVLADEIISLVKKTDNKSHWEDKEHPYNFMSGPASVNAAALEMLAEYDDNNPLINETIRFLIQSKDKNNGWGTTKTTAEVLETLSKIIKKHNAFILNANYDIAVNGIQINSGKFTRSDILKTLTESIPLDRLNIGEENSLRLSKSGFGSLYYTANLKYYMPFEISNAKEHGFSIVREFVDNSGKIIKSPDFKEGDDAWVRLLVVVPDVRNHVVVEDFLPAGLESVNSSLKNSGIVMGNQPTVDDSETSLWSAYYFNHHEFRDDRTAFFASYLQPGVYEIMYKVRATTPGNYQFPPANAYEMYNPDVFGLSAGHWLEIDLVK